MGGGGGVAMPKYFMDLKKCWGIEKCLGVCQQILCMDLKKCRGGGGDGMPKYFRDLKKN